MIDFILYVFCLATGAIAGAILGRRFMVWAWGDAKVEDRKELIFWITLFTACAYFGARRLW